jgi:hypothetical protein
MKGVSVSKPRRFLQDAQRATYSETEAKNGRARKVLGTHTRASLSEFGCALPTHSLPNLTTHA